MYSISNTFSSSDALSVLRDLRVLIYTQRSYWLDNRANTRILNAYFCDADGNKLAGTPDIPVSNNIPLNNGSLPLYGIDGLYSEPGSSMGSTLARYPASPYLYTVCFDSLPEGAITHPNVPLIDFDGNNIYDDLPPGESFYFAVDYDIQYDHVQYLDEQNNYITDVDKTGFVLFHRVYGIMFFKNECDNYMGFSRPYGSPGTSNPNPTCKPDTELCMGEPPTELNNKNIQTGDELLLSMLLPPARSGLSRTGYLINTNLIRTVYNHGVQVTLPEGFEYDATVGIKIANSQVSASDINYDPATRLLSFRNKIDMRNNARVDIGIKAAGTILENHTLDVKFTFNFEGEDPVIYQAYKIIIEYTQIFTCDTGIEVSDFIAERTTFGYTDNTMTTLANKNTQGVNLQAAGPYDNVVLKGYFCVKSPVTLTATDRLLSKISYQYAGNEDFFSFPDTGKAALIRRKPSDSAIYTDSIYLPLSDLMIDITAPNHEAVIDLTPYVLSNQLVLNTGDSLNIQLFTRITENVPRVATNISEFKQEIYIEDNEGNRIECDPRLSDFVVVNYKLGAIIGVGGSGETYIANEPSSYGTLVRWYLGEGVSGNELFTNEFRPNAIYKNIVVEYEGLLDIQSIIIKHGNSNAQNATLYTDAVLQEGIDYTVTYNLGKTVIEVTNDAPSAIKTAEYWGSYGSGMTYHINFTCIGTNSPNPTKLKHTLTSIDYPTSEIKNLERVYQTSAGGIVVEWKDYSYNLTTSAANYTPITDIAQWYFTISNTSSWSATDGLLPNSWLAIEGLGDMDMIDTAWLYDESNTQLLGTFVSGNNGVADDKYWLKFVDTIDGEELDINNFKTFSLRVRYKSCGGSNSQIKLTYGMSNIAYPDDPWTGYVSEYNTPVTYNTKDLILGITPPFSDFSVSIKDDEDMNSSGIYQVCSPLNLEVTFRNGNVAVIDDLKIRVKLLPNMLFVNSFTPQLKIDDGNYSDFGGSIINGSGYVDIILPLSLQLQSTGTAGSEITVKFQMEPQCGYISSLIQLQLSGTTLCGDIIQKPVNTRPIRIGEVSVPSISIANVRIKEAGAAEGTPATENSVPVSYKNNTEGKFTLSLDYMWNNFSSDVLFAYIDLPNQIQLDENGTATLQQADGTFSDFEIDGQSGASITRYKVKITQPDNFDSPQAYPASLDLKAVNAELWDCEEHSIFSWAAITSRQTCHGEDCEVYSVATAANAKVRMEKVALSFSDVKATSMYYDNTTETATFTGALVNSSDVALSSAVINVYVNNNGTYTPLTGNNTITVNDIAANSSKDFSASFNIPANEVCRLVLMLQTENNPWICGDVTGNLNVKYQFANNKISVCQNLAQPIGNPAIDGYSYSWSPSLYLSNSQVAQPEFHFPNTITSADSIRYTVTITRESGCATQDTLWVKINPQPTISTVSKISSPNQSVDLNTLVNNLVENTVVSFYSDPEATQIINPTVAPAETTTYYAKSVNTKTLCESDVEPVKVIILLSVIWTPENNINGDDNSKRDWNNPLNWNEEIVPLEYSTVYIPGTASHFPFLTSAEKYACHHIYLMHGAEVGQPQFLTYNKASVQMNFGVADPDHSDDLNEHLAFSAKRSRGNLERNKWHMLSAPLQRMVSGDFSLGGYPASYMRKFDAKQPESGSVLTGNWTQYYNSGIIEFEPGEGFILWMNETRNEDKYYDYRKGVDPLISSQEHEYGLKQLNGILEFPYYEDEAMSTAHRVHTVNGNQSTFYYVMENPEYQNFMELINKTDTYDRGNGTAYRLHTENYNYTIKVSNGIKVALTGNPYMSTIDFDKFYADNSDKIKPNYQVWTGNGFSTYTPSASSGEVALDKYIPPMQAFLVELQEGVVSDFELHYNLANISVPRPVTTNSGLRVSGQNKKENVLQIKAVNEFGSTVTSIVAGNNGSVEVSNSDSRKIISGLRTIPELYTLKKESSRPTGVSSNYIYKDEIISIPVALATATEGHTSFILTGMDGYDANIAFIDSWKNYEMTLTGMESFEYTFDYTPAVNANNEMVATENRFYIRISGIDNNSSASPDDITAFVNETGIHLLSALTNLISEIQVSDTQGKLFYSDLQVNSSYYNIKDKTLFPQLLIIRIVTEKGVKNIKLISK